MSEQEQQKRMQELLIQGITDLKTLCRKSHKGGPGGAAICICGAGGGGSSACGALRVIRDAIRYKGQMSEETMRILDSYL